jgi:beta-glucanase (GH16 family)
MLGHFRRLRTDLRGERLLGLVAGSIAFTLVGCSEHGSERGAGEATGKAKSALGNSSFVPTGYGCAWHDEFGGDQGLGQPQADLDQSSWSFQEINVNGEAQAYTTKQCLEFTNDWNYCVQDGRLRIQGRNEFINCDLNNDGIEDNPICAPDYGQSFHRTANYTSGRLLTKQKVHFSDGYIEFRVKLPQADRPGLPESGFWPAVWMLGEDINQGPPPGSVGWPACGEVDMMEWASGGGISQMGWNAIWLGAGGTNACSAWPQGGNAACGPCPPVNGQCVGEVTNGSQYEMTGWPSFDHHAWHTYGLLWQNTGNNATDQMTYFIDGVMMGVFNLGAAQSAFKADMFLTMNMALGGTLGAPIQITDWANAYMDIDYVRWYRTGQADVCGLGAASDGGADASSDAAVDATVDGGVGASSDAGVDESEDEGVDAGADVDAGVDASADGGADAGDAGAEAGTGVPSPCTGLPDGTSCSDGNLCNGQETCQSGVCSPGVMVTCAAIDGCHVAGTCNPSTGLCSDPAAPDGTSCSDGDLCNGQETCQSGVCSPGVVVTCAAIDGCHVAGTCIPSTGLCSDPAAPDGTSCADANACNGRGTCEGGSCTGTACPPPPPVQINAGGTPVAPYVADEDFSGGTTIDHANAIDVTAVSNPAPAAVYQSARINNFTYTVPGFVARSSHTVRLHFAETHFSTSGSRTFNVTINGGQVLTKFDIYKTAGAKNKAVVEAFTVNADAGGNFVIKFTSVVNQSLVSAIEIE